MNFNKIEYFLYYKMATKLNSMARKGVDVLESARNAMEKRCRCP